MSILVRKLLKIHRILGLVLAINFLVLGLTGVVLVWRHELSPVQSVEQKSVFISEESSLSKIENYLSENESYKDKKVLSIFKGDDGDIQARVTEPGIEKFKGAMRLKFDLAGNVLSSNQIKPTALIDFILKLHRELLLGGKGKILIGLMGLFFLIALFSGALIANKFYRNVKTMNSRILLGRFHKIIGVKTLAWLIIVTFTGAILAFNSTLIGLFLRDNVRAHQANAIVIENAKYVSVTTVLKELEVKLPHLEYDFISFPDNEFSVPNQFVVLMESEEHHHEIAYVDGITGKLNRIVSLPWYLELLILSEPLHFGDYGGVVLKIIWSVLGLISSFIPISGIYIFLFRRKYLAVKPGVYDGHLLNDTNVSTLEVLLPTMFVFVIFFITSDFKWILSTLFLIYLIFSWRDLLIYLMTFRKKVKRSQGRVS
ncbi:PepSY domain protein [Bacteriovorax sp. BAL6_X]|uniref:PepSY-associated TM helix domain-containing protein n=1 Tax=Bacteriovorax sp. BAL6_X TaxID=1201290 RepID=UPI0003855DF8|nr:PepSY-associated TM helix domain-containing protein [Bacteriovorax sp. BAL6_X]EPZ49838.1 PepSY domain protein [Bacteriovorax sp. BAL6_X]